MKKLTGKQLKQLYLEFFKKRGHAIIFSASLIPEGDPTVLFTTAGMHPLVPYLLGQPHPLGKRLANVQKCLRTDDIDQVGDPFHHTFFEMLGNWSLGDYFKEEAIKLSHEFLTSKEWLGIDQNRLYITVFAGDKDAPKDEESARAWQSLGIPKERIIYNPKKDNWWGPAGRTGPCGPDTEMFYDTGKQKCSPDCRPGCSCSKYFEIWNDVFMQYNKTEEGKYELLKQKNVDTGMGVERTVAILQGMDNDYDTELFKPIMDKLKELCKKEEFTEKELKSARIVSDHLKAATFILGDGKGISPSNVDKGYILRRLIRRSIRYGKELGIDKSFCAKIAEIVNELYKGDYPELERNKGFIFEELNKEEERFENTLKEGLKLVEKLFSEKVPIQREKFVQLMQIQEKKEILREIFRNKKENKDHSVSQANISKEEIDKATISGKEAFDLYQSFGFPIEIITELVREKSLLVDIESFGEEFQKHQDLSRLATEKRFKSGLADYKAETIKLHTATHLLHAALRQVLGPHVRQRGSNITADRLRFDFSHDKKMTPEEIKKVEEMVNERIRQSIPVVREEMALEEAKKSGAIAFFEEKYGEKVSVYTIGDFSKEICSGPHVENTLELGYFKILKEEASAAGVRRIKATVAPELPEPRYISY